MARETVSGTKNQPDPVIAELERQGEYTPELMKEIQKIVENNKNAKAISLKDLPEPLQKAIGTVGIQAEEKIQKIPNANGMRKAVYTAITKLNAKVGPDPQATRHYVVSKREQEPITVGSLADN